MTFKFSGALGLALLAASFAFGGSSVYAQTSETEASALPVAATELNVNKDAIACESSDAAACNSEAEADALPAGAAPEVDQAAVSEAETPATEPSAPGITSYDAIVVDVVETVTVAIPGDQSVEETPAYTGTLTLEDAITPPAPTVEEPAVGATDADIFDDLE